MIRRTLPIVILLSVIFAGCVTNEPPVDDTESNRTASMVERAGVDALPAQLAEVEPFEAVAHDGAVLRGHVYLPEGPGPFATVLEFSPYWNHGAGRPSDGQAVTVDGGRVTMAPKWQAMFDAGFAIALVSLRGSGTSDGCFSYINLPVDGQDAAVVINAIAEQSWSNGNVGMYGISYAGASQMAAVAHGPPPALKAVVPSSGHIDTWNLLGRYGVPVRIAPAHPTSRDLLQGAGLGGASAGYPPTPEHYCPSTLEGEVAYQQLVTRGDKDEWFQARDLRAQLAEQSVPMWATNGLASGEGHILQFEGLWEVMPDERRLLIGQWPHAFPSGDHFEWPDVLVPWFDHYLRDGPKTAATGVVEYQDDTGAWHESTQWPPAGDDVTLLLSDYDLVSEDAPPQPSDRRFLSSPANPDPSACEDDHVAYVSPPLEETVLIAGNFEVNLTITSTHSDGNIAAFLYHAVNQPACVGSGVTTGSGNAVEVRRAVSDLYHRGHLEHGRDFPVGSPDEVGLKSYPFASLVPAGHRLILSIGGGAADALPDSDAPLLTIHTGDSVEARLTLRVVEGNLTFADDGGDVLRFGLPFTTYEPGPGDHHS